MPINEQQQAVISQYIKVQDCSNIAEIITNISDKNDEKYLHTFNIIIEMSKNSNMFNTANIIKLANIYDVCASSPATTLEFALTSFYEQIGGILSSTQSVVSSSEVEKYNEFFKSLSNLSREEQVKKIANSFSTEEIIKIMHILRTKLAPGIESRNIDEKLTNDITLLKEVFLFQKDGGKKEYSIWSNNEITSLEEIERRKPVRVVKGMGVLEELYKVYKHSLGE